MNIADMETLAHYFSEYLTHIMKVPIPIVCTSKNIFIGKSSDQEKKKTYIVKQEKWKPNKSIYIEYLAN